MNIRTLIVDDEPHAREGIRIRLKESSNIEIIGECSSGVEALEFIHALKPDLVFLDIQMPEMNGFEIVQKIEIKPIPIIIFITAYDSYAVKAFEYHALDYLLKPINDKRFKDMLKSVISEITHRNLEKYSNTLKLLVNEYFEKVESNYEEPKLSKQKKKDAYLVRLMIKAKDHISFITSDEIEWIESAGDYVYIHSNSKKNIVRETLTSLEEKLDPQKFARIHRSAIVNVEKIKSLRPNESGDYDVFLHTGTKLKLSRTYRDHFQNIMKNSF
jgi:two-component system, LytTR family, response regulator